MKSPATYSPPPLMQNGHIQTIFPSLFRRIKNVKYVRERIDTPDDDFLDLDWSRCGSRRLAIISHGLEGDSDRAYVKGMVRALNLYGWDCLAWNFRGCSGEPNRRLKSYHSGSFDDLGLVIEHAAAHYPYTRIGLVGFSIGGNITLLYLGKNRDQVNHRVNCAAVLSVPCDLAAGAEALARRSNAVYMQRFLKLLGAKVRAKKALFPDRIDLSDYHTLRNFRDFDERYTAPINGFRDANDYWTQCSSKPWISGIAVPTLMIAAMNDPFLVPACFPTVEAAVNPVVHLDMPSSGGHVGFVQFNHNGLYWSEKRIAEFFEQVGDGAGS